MFCLADLRLIALKYGLFALAATLLNLFFQFLSFRLYSGFLSLYIAMGVGTLAGLVAKYLLDKKYIFGHVTRHFREDAAKFLAYSLTGVLTTALFWGTEISFTFVFDHPQAKYLGATLGLTGGYLIKYYLDKHLVFGNRS